MPANARLHGDTTHKACSINSHHHENLKIYLEAKSCIPYVLERILFWYPHFFRQNKSWTYLCWCEKYMVCSWPDVVLLCLRGWDIRQATVGSLALPRNSLAFSCCKSHSERVESTPGTATTYLPGGGLLLVTVLSHTVEPNKLLHVVELDVCVHRFAWLAEIESPMVSRFLTWVINGLCPFNVMNVDLLSAPG